MNKDVQKALTALSNPNRLISESREAVVVYKDDLEKLVNWAKEQVDLESELKVGDKVQCLQMTVSLEREIAVGEIGEVVEIQSSVFTAFPYAVMFDGVHFTTRFARHELRKVEGEWLCWLDF